MTELTVWGGAGEHGRSCYVLSDGRVRVMLDCGVKKAGAGEYPLLDETVVSQLDAVFLSHSHEDHSMAIPLLYKMGYAGTVWTTRETEEQLSGYFASWQTYAERHAAGLPYGPEHITAIRCAYLEDAAPARHWFEAAPGIRARWGRSGHLLGSVWLQLDLNGKRIFFSGDYSGESSLLAADSPEWTDCSATSPETIDLAIVDAAYGLDRERQDEKISRLRSAVAHTLERGGTVLLPVPAVGRGQELLLWARETFADCPLLAEKELLAGLERLALRPEWLKPGAVERIHALLAGRSFQVAEDDVHRERFLTSGRGGIIVTSDGMMHSAKAQWYYERLVGSEDNVVILTGHLAPGSFGRTLLEVPAAAGRCRALFVSYKVHQGLPDVRAMLRAVPSRRSLLVHAAKDGTDALRRQLEEETFQGLFSLQAGETLPF
ncbi:MBL fold metallo-hydrolase [Paenibacillus hodogayensis]|uniref:MBL fold metallo-hydrolase n=1 Tax=Paenibacillus hodogayensis TaxID=279208 RepID=A0ABV5W6L3_9BACL